MQIQARVVVAGASFLPSLWQKHDTRHRCFRCKVKGKQLRFQSALQTKFFKIERRNIMITYYNHTHMTAVPTRLLLDTNLSAEA